MNSVTCEIPQDAREAELVYKQIGQRKIQLSFRPPLRRVYDRAPLYLIISGGGWHCESRTDMLVFSGVSVEELRRKGFAVASIDYRVTVEPGIFMRHIVNDCFDALRYLAHFADILEIDAGRFAVSGHSAGGHLALMLAYAPETLFRDDAIFSDPFTVRCAVPMSPPTILYDGEYPKTHALTDIRQNFPDPDDQQERKALSPSEYIRSDCPPTLYIAGTSDHLVFSNSSEILHSLMRKAGAESGLLLSVCGGHCFEQIHPGILPVPDMDGAQHAATMYILAHT